MITYIAFHPLGDQIFHLCGKSCVVWSYTFLECFVFPDIVDKQANLVLVDVVERPWKRADMRLALI